MRAERIEVVLGSVLEALQLLDARLDLGALVWLDLIGVDLRLQVPGKARRLFLRFDSRRFDRSIAAASTFARAMAPTFGNERPWARWSFRNRNSSCEANRRSFAFPNTVAIADSS